MKQKDTYKEVRTLCRNGIVARVHIPDLTEEERSRRMREIERAAARLLASRK
jgi:hypothetical protein